MSHDDDEALATTRQLFGGLFGGSTDAVTEPEDPKRGNYVPREGYSGGNPRGSEVIEALEAVHDIFGPVPLRYR